MSFSEKELFCEMTFRKAGMFWHLWTPENFEIIFTCQDDFKAGMNIIGISAKLFPSVKIITFELMTNHLHIMACGDEYTLVMMFEMLTKMLSSFFRSQGRIIGWDRFNESHRVLETLDSARNVIVYDNRNGFVVSDIHTPYTYPWGANRYYFCQDSKQLAIQNSKKISVHEKRRFSRSHMSDTIELLSFEGYALPLSFCDIGLGEQLFHSANHYFLKISKCIESNSKIAREIGESVYYNDDDLFSVIIGLCKSDFANRAPSTLSPEARLEIAKKVRYEYNASAKQIQRMLKLDAGTLASLGIK